MKNNLLEFNGNMPEYIEKIVQQFAELETDIHQLKADYSQKRVNMLAQGLIDLAKTNLGVDADTLPQRHWRCKTA